MAKVQYLCRHSGPHIFNNVASSDHNSSHYHGCHRNYNFHSRLPKDLNFYIPVVIVIVNRTYFKFHFESNFCNNT
jgi:hypothetical protein